MSHVFGYLCSDDSLTHAVMTDFKGQLNPIDPQRNNGLGIGWLQQGRTLVRKHPTRPDSTDDLLDLLSDIPTRAMVAHIQRATSGHIAAADLQPFRYRNWVYAQHGAFAGDPARIQEFTDSLIADLPDHLRRNLQGQTAADVIFHVLLTHLTEQDAFNMQLTPTRHATILARALQTLQEKTLAHHLDPLTPLLNVAITERQLFATRIGAPLYYRLYEGIQEPGEKPLFAGHRTHPIEHPRFRAVIVTNQVSPTTEDSPWIEIPDNHILWVESGWQIKTAPIAQLAG